LLDNLRPLKPEPQPAKHDAYRQRVDISVNERIACALEGLLAQQQSISGQTGWPKLMNFEEAVAATRLGRSTIESMIRSGRFRDGRHYVKENGRVLFHYELVDRMFEDKLDMAVIEPVSTETHSATAQDKPENGAAAAAVATAAAPKKPASQKPSCQNPKDEGSFNINYAKKGRS
jgi:hypothetical protein